MHDPSPRDDDSAELTAELRDYMIACIRAARPSPSRDAALAFLADLEIEFELEDAWEMAAAPVDWAELETEAAQRGCTVADLIAHRAGGLPDAL